MRGETMLRLDTADLAIEAGWQLESMQRFDEFSKDGVTILVRYSADDEIDSLIRSREGCDDEVYGADSPGKAERLRIWLGVRAIAHPSPFPGEIDPKVPVAVQRLRAEGKTGAAYVLDGDDIQILGRVDQDAYATARDYIRAYDGRARVMWSRDGSVSPSGNDQEMWWAEMPLPDGRVVGWFWVNQNFAGR